MGLPTRKTLLTDNVNVNLFLSHFDEFLQGRDQSEVSEMLIAKISSIREYKRRHR